MLKYDAIVIYFSISIEFDLIISEKHCISSTLTPRLLIAAKDVSYVVFGTSDLGSGGTVELSSLDGSNGFVLGVTGDDISGLVVNTAGDVNGDGFDDLLIC